MKTFSKAVLLGGVFLVLMSADIRFTPLMKAGWFATAEAILGVRRRTMRRTAVVVGTEAYAAGAAAGAAAASSASQAAAEPQPAPPPPAAGTPPPANTGAALPLGTVVASLPDGCTSAPAGGVDYYKCGPNYYRAVFQGNNLVYVTAQP